MKRYLNLVHHYESKFRQYGDTAKGFDWPDELGAQVRHQVMWDLIPDQVTKFSLLDFGCGSMQFMDFLKREGLLDSREVLYMGLDLSETFLKKAAEKYPHITSFQKDILDDEDYLEIPEVDYVICNGVFTLKNQMSVAEMNLFFETSLERLYKKARRGLSFNVMSLDIVDHQRDDLYFRSFSNVGRLIKERLQNKNFVFRQDYGLYEFTTYIYK